MHLYKKYSKIYAQYIHQFVTNYTLTSLIPQNINTLHDKQYTYLSVLLCESPKNITLNDQNNSIYFYYLLHDGDTVHSRPSAHTPT